MQRRFWKGQVSITSVLIDPTRIIIGLRSSFYKGAYSKPAKLKKMLVLTFSNSGEQGSDAGTLRKEFFEDSLKAVNEHLFEGEAHSILQEGPAMPFLSHSVFNYLVNGEIVMCYPTSP